MDLFEWCYETRTEGIGVVWYELKHLPGPGGVGDQDARTMALLQVIANVQTALAREAVAAKRKQN